MITKIKIALAFAAVLTLALGWVEIKALQADKARLEQSVALAGNEARILRNEARVLRKALADNHAALGERERQTAALAAQTEELRRELEELYQNDQPCQTWADSPVPDPVYRRLRK